MKKFTKILAVSLMTVLCVTALAGCGTTENKYIEMTPVSYKALHYVELGDYSSFPVTLKKSDYTVTDAEVKSEVNEEVKNTPEYLYQDRKVVKAKDIINIDMQLTVDGEEQPDGDLSEYNMQLGDNMMEIDGFDEELVGHKVEDVVTIKKDFPSDYGVEEFQGKAGVFKVTINGIMKAVKKNYNNLTDHYVYQAFEYETVDSYLAAVRESLQSTKDSQKDEDVREAVSDQLLKRSKIKRIPEGLEELRVAEYKNYQIYLANLKGVSIDDYLADEGLTEEKWDKQVRKYIKKMVKKELIYMAVVEKENLAKDEDNYTQYVSGMMSTEGFTDEEEFHKIFPEDYCYMLYCEQIALNYLVKNADVTYK